MNHERDKSVSKGQRSEEGANGKSGAISVPSISLPKGGGAIRGIGEKFAANPVTGTGSMTVPIATSPGRSGFGPQLSLSYDSGAGNGPFGFGWSLSLPSITRKTDKGLPQYRDAEESDVFILSGAEDLVPGAAARRQQDLRIRSPCAGYTRSIGYRPRIEGLFARIERWTNQADRRNPLAFDLAATTSPRCTARLPKAASADPADPTRIFSWLICESYDDKGNAIVYEYKAEDSDDVESDGRQRDAIAAALGAALPQAHQVRQPDSAPGRPKISRRRADWMFEVVFDYGEHYPDDASRIPTSVSADDTRRMGRAPRSVLHLPRRLRGAHLSLCRRVLMFHHFPDELGDWQRLPGARPLISLLRADLAIEQPDCSFIASVTQSGYETTSRTGVPTCKKSLPPLEFEYSEAKIQETVREVDAASLENLPIGLDGAATSGSISTAKALRNPDRAGATPGFTSAT